MADTSQEVGETTPVHPSAPDNTAEVSRLTPLPDSDESFQLEIELPDGKTMQEVFRANDDISLVTIHISGKIGIASSAISLFLGDVQLTTQGALAQIPELASGSYIKVIITEDASQTSLATNNDQCELCGAPPQFICHCRGAFFCQTCIGVHMANELSPNHIPAPISAPEIRRAMAETAVDIQYLSQKAHEEELMKTAFDETLMESLRQKQEIARKSTADIVSQFNKLVQHLHDDIDTTKELIIGQMEERQNQYIEKLDKSCSIVGQRDQYDRDEILRTRDSRGNVNSTFQILSAVNCLKSTMERIGYIPKPIKRPEICFDPDHLGTGVELTRLNMLATNNSTNYGSAVLNTYFESQIGIVTIYIAKQSKYTRIGFVQDLKHKQRNEFLKFNASLNFWIWQANGDMETKDSKTKFMGYDTGDTLVFRYNSAQGSIRCVKEGSNDEYIFENVSPRVLFSINLYTTGDSILLKEITTQQL